MGSTRFSEMAFGYRLNVGFQHPNSLFDQSINVLFLVNEFIVPKYEITRNYTPVFPKCNEKVQRFVPEGQTSPKLTYSLVSYERQSAVSSEA